MVGEIGIMALAGVWRMVHGIGFGSRWSRQIVGLIVAMAAVWIGTGNVYALPIALGAMVSMNASVSQFIPQGWASWWMGLRYSVPMALMVGFAQIWLDFSYYGIPTIPLAVLAGLVYPVFSWGVIKFNKPNLDWARVGEFIVGAFAIGSLALL